MLINQRGIMENFIACLILLFIFATHAQAADKKTKFGNACPEVLQVKLKNLHKEKANLCDYSGQVVLMVNTASYCGFTGQYKGLEALYSKYKGQGFTVLGFPSNDFGNQEPGSGEEIAKFCKLTYGVEFPMFEKANITGKRPSAPYPYLIKETGQTPQWNFHKYLVSRDGKTIKSFASEVTPEAADFVTELEAMLLQKQ
jgi:glutathione peroxidase